MYTIERHLSEAASNNSYYKLLESIWTMNKNVIPYAQSAITYNFPHYSLHETSHSVTIIRNIESFLGEERVKNLSPTDAWLILMSAYTHDLGMVVFHNVLERKWKHKDFQDYLLGLARNGYDKSLKEAALILLKIDNYEEFSKVENVSVTNESYSINSLNIRKAVTLITSDYFRRNHHQRSRDMIDGSDQEFHKYVESFIMHNIPSRFKTVLADIAYAHGIDFYNVIDKLEYISDGFGSDKMHPRFVAYLLRLGDLLDVDDKRFNVFYNKVFSEDLPHTSQLHAQKHASIKHLLISPKSIEVTVDCVTDEVYRTAREWFDWLQREVENQSREWGNITPDNLDGMPPTISRGKIKILYKSFQPVEDLMNLRFSITNEKVFEILEGSGIYEETGFVFLRELVQNSYDAIKIQLWEMIRSGYYNFLLKRHLNKGKDLLPDDITNDELSKLVKYPIDLPKELWENFFININIYWKENESVLVIEVHDNGSGISESSIIRMTKKVGESRSKNASFIALKETMPYWIKPTGAFGIGLQSIFLVSNSFVLQTKTDLEESKEIIFYSAKNGEYSRITDEKPLGERGTKIIIEIPRKKFDEVFPSVFDWGMVERYDIFNDKFKDIYLHKLQAYIIKEFYNINLINVNITGHKFNFRNNKGFDYNDSSIGELMMKKNDDIIVTIDNITNLDHNAFIVYEEKEIGSTMRLEFHNFLHNNSQIFEAEHYIKTECLVRGVPVKESVENFYLVKYLSVVIDFQSPESDKLLTLSRDKFIPKMRRKYYNKFLYQVMPKIVPMCIDLFEKKYVNNYNESTAIEYLHLEMTAVMADNNVKPNSLSNIYKDFSFPVSYIVTQDQKPIKFKDFFKVSRVLYINWVNTNNENPVTKSKIEAYNELTDIDFTVDAIILNEEYFNFYLDMLDFNKILHNRVNDENGYYTISVFDRQDKESAVVYNQEAKEHLFDSIVQQVSSVRRQAIEPISDYAEVLAVGKSYDEFQPRISRVNKFIISPYSNSSAFRKFMSIIDDSSKYADELELRSHIHDVHLNNLITDSLVEFILENSYYKAHKDKDSIIEAYLNLIMESVKIYRSKKSV